MGLRSLSETVGPRKDEAAASVLVGEDQLRFRRPRVADLTPPREVLEKIDDSAAGLTIDQVYGCYLLGCCYLPDDTDKLEEPSWLLFARIAETNDIVFADIQKGFEAAFPEFCDWFTTRLTAKNA